MKNLRLLIRRILIESQKKKLIMEPDDVEGPNDQPEVEASVSANVAGVTTPLGAESTYPDKSNRKKKTPAEVAGAAFGGAKLRKK